MRARLAEIESFADPDIQRQKLAALYADLDQLTRDLTADPDTAQALDGMITDGVIKGLAGKDGDAPPIYNGGPGSGRRAIPEGEAPKRISVDEANRRLANGEQAQDADGLQVRFGSEMRDKITDDRKQLLDWGKDTVATGTKIPFVEKGEQRTRYGKIYRDDAKRRAFQVIVDTKDGYAFNMHILRPSQLAAKIGNRKGANTGEQPPAGVRQSEAAAGRLPDYLKHTPRWELVNL